jgi:hypothetical protein
MNALLALAVALLLVSNDHAPEACPMPVFPLVTAFNSCVLTNAQRMETSREAADAVATRAVAACESLREPVRAAAAKCFSAEEVKTLIEKLDSVAHDGAVRAITDVRAGQGSD